MSDGTAHTLSGKVTEKKQSDKQQIASVGLCGRDRIAVMFLAG